MGSLLELLKCCIRVRCCDSMCCAGLNVVLMTWKIVPPCGEGFPLRIRYMESPKLSTRRTISTFVPFVSSNELIIHIYLRYFMVFMSVGALIIDELINLHRGQGMDLYWRDSLSCPTEQEYIEMVNNKTGGLLRLAVKLMQACSSSTVYHL